MTGSTSADTAAWSVEVERLVAEELAPGVWYAGLPEGAVSGTARGLVRGSGVDGPRWSTSVVLASSTLAGVVLDSAEVSADGDLRSASGMISYLEAEAGRLRARVGVEWSEASVVARLDSAYLQLPAADSATVLRFAARGRMAADSLRLGLDLSASRLAGLALDSGRVELDGTRAEVGYRARLLVPDSGRIEARGRVSRRDGETVLAVEEGVAVGLDVAALPGGGGVGGVLGGETTLMVTRRAAGDVAVEGTVTGRRRRPADGAVDLLEARVRTERDGRHHVEGTLVPAEGGGLELVGAVDVRADTLDAELTATGRLPDPVEVLGGARADSVRLSLDAVRVDELELRGRGELVGLEARGLTADTVRVAGSLGPEGFSVDTAIVRSPVAALDAGGRLRRRSAGAIPDTARVVVEVRELGPLAELLETDLRGGGGVVSVTLSGHVDSTNVAGELALADLAVGDVVFAAMDGRVDATLGGPSWESALAGVRGRVELEVGRVALPEADVRRVTVVASGGPDSVRIEAEADVDDLRRAEASVVLDPRPERRMVRVDRMRFQLDRDDWLLRSPALVSYRDGVSVDSLVLAALVQEIRLAGGLVGDSLDVRLRTDSIDVGTLSDLAGFAALDGWLTMDAELQGAPAAPRGHADLRGSFGRNGSARSGAEVRLDFEDSRARVDAALSREGGRATVRGSVPLTAEDSLGLELFADSLALAWVLPFLDPDVVSELSGTVQADVAVGGSWADPEASGGLLVRDGLVGLPSLGLRWTDVRGAGRIERETLVVDSLDLRSESGTARLTGSVRADDGGLDLGLELDRFQAIRSPQVQAVVSGRVDVGGRATEPQVEGSLRLDALDVYLDERVGSDGLEDVELSEEDLETLRERFGYTPPESTESAPALFEATGLDVALDVGRDSWIRKRASPEMAVPFTGSLDVGKRPGADLTVDGTLELVPGRGFVEQFGRRFALSEGTVEFRGPPTEARVDLTATYTVPSHDTPDEAEVTIRLDVRGTRDALDLTLSSEPQMENADVVSYIATGRPASGELSFSGGDSEGGLVAAGAGLALGQLTGLVESAAQSSVGLDVVEIRREGLREATLVAGKYVSPRLYLGLAQPVSLREGDGLSLGGEGESEAEVEYEAFRWLLLNVEVSGNDFRLFLRTRFAY